LSKSEEFRAGLQAFYKYKKGDITLKSAFNAIINNNKKTSFPSVNKGNSFIFDVYNRYYFNKNTQFLIGLNAQKLKMTSFEIPFSASSLSKVIDQADFNIIDPYANFVLNTKNGFNINVGGRLNHHSTYGWHGIYTINPSYNFKLNKAKFKLMASYSTAYITPTLFQLFSPNYGFNNLKPEENTSLESGFTFTHKNLYFDMVYFYRQEKNFIDFTLLDPATFAFGYRNAAQDFYAHGFETNLKIKLSDKLQLLENYTYTKVVVLKSYSLFSLHINHLLLNKRLKLYANLTNIFNVNYQELVGFNTRGRNILLGMQLNIK